MGEQVLRIYLFFFLSLSHRGRTFNVASGWCVRRVCLVHWLLLLFFHSVTILPLRIFLFFLAFLFPQRFFLLFLSVFIVTVSIWNAFGVYKYKESRIVTEKRSQTFSKYTCMQNVLYLICPRNSEIKMIDNNFHHSKAKEKKNDGSIVSMYQYGKIFICCWDDKNKNTNWERGG